MDGLIRQLVSIDDSQFGFIPGRGTTDTIFVVRQQKRSTLQRRYNAVAYNTETVITRLGLGSRFFPHQFESVALFPRNAAI